jgi:hypothetical protein
VTTTYWLTQLEVLGDCNVGFDLDHCNGTTCIQGGLAAGEGRSGVDNGLAGLAPVFAGVGGDLGGVDQALDDSLCGITDADDSVPGCETVVASLELRFVVEPDVSEDCAIVTVFAGGVEVGKVNMNLSEPGCLSGKLPDLPVLILGEQGIFQQVFLATNLSTAGFSNGRMGVTMGTDTVVEVAEAILPGAGAVVGQVFDINEDGHGDTSSVCNALSATYQVGGVAE